MDDLDHLLMDDLDHLDGLDDLLDDLSTVLLYIWFYIRCVKVIMPGKGRVLTKYGRVTLYEDLLTLVDQVQKGLLLKMALAFRGEAEQIVLLLDARP